MASPTLRSFFFSSSTFSWSGATPGTSRPAPGTSGAADRSGSTAIRVEGLSKTFDTAAVLHDFHLDVRAGELLGLLGPSGSGKTTLLRIIAGLDFPDRGRVLFGGDDATGLPVQQRAVGFVFQHYALFKHMSVADNIAYGLNARKRADRPGKAEIRRRVGDLLDLIKLSGFADRYPSQLSGGQRQRIALARALAVEPRVLLLDEPFGALDAQVRKDLRRWLREIHDRTGQTTIFVTHDQDEALELSDRVAVLDKGRLEQVGTPDEVQDRPASATVLKFLGDAVELEALAEGGRVLVDGRPTPVTAPRGVIGPARLYVRPWQLQFVEPAEAHLSGTVRASHRSQGRQRVEVERPDGRLVVVEDFDGERYAAGRPVGLRINGGYVFADVADVSGDFRWEDRLGGMRAAFTAPRKAGN
ncbi:sulfate/molybdate ABC transporter ATP-binding protein [Methylobacterium durans]|uniref:sulfate/molybdate ABC transporter ATP-binding protein n=1 Tax=Methylobacterium durans TaxID=2202825 RepID=UPI003AB060C1